MIVQFLKTGYLLRSDWVIGIASETPHTVVAIAIPAAALMPSYFIHPLYKDEKVLNASSKPIDSNV